MYKTGRQKQKAFFAEQWFLYVLVKLALADMDDIHPTMRSKISIRDIENKLTAKWHHANVESDT